MDVNQHCQQHVWPVLFLSSIMRYPAPWIMVNETFLEYKQKICELLLGKPHQPLTAKRMTPFQMCQGSSCAGLNADTAK